MYTCNKIACFDRGDVNRINDLGINNVSHLPLASDSRFFNTTDIKYICDISFVGTLYTDKAQLLRSDYS